MRVALDDIYMIYTKLCECCGCFIHWCSWHL